MQSVEDTQMPFDFLKRSFQQWAEALNNVDNPSLEESLLIYKTHSIEFPRLVSPCHDYPLKIFRARIISDESEDDISNPRTFSYPPKAKATCYQRANVPGFPVFYGAMDGKTALEELRNYSNMPIQKGDKVYLSEWKLKPGSSYTLNYLTLSNIIGEQHLFSDITKKIDAEFERIFYNEPEALKQKQKFLFEQVSELFLTGNYFQSGLIAYQILYNSPVIKDIKIDGIFYPSCSNNYRSVNCAFLPEFVDQNLELEIVRKVSFEEFTGNGAYSNGKYFGIVEKNQVIWRTYITELMIHDYEYELLLTDKWLDEHIEQSNFFLGNKYMDLQEFCRKRIETIDLSNHRIPQKNEHLYRENGTILFRFTYQFRDDDCTLRFQGRINNISEIVIKIPVKAQTKVVLKDVAFKG